MNRKIATGIIGILDLKNCSRAPQTKSSATSAPLQSYTPPEYLQKSRLPLSIFPSPNRRLVDGGQWGRYRG
jgi:hypothetical protein